MNAQYRSELDRIFLTDGDKRALIRSLTARGARPARRPRRALRVPAAAAAVLCALAVGVGAAVTGAPVLRDYFGGGAGYEQSAVALGESVTKNGWTMTLTDCVADDYNLYVGFTLTAPEGTVLDAEHGYQFETWRSPRIVSLKLGGSSHYTLLEDEDPADNVLHFILWSSYLMEEGQRLSGRTAELTFGGLYHPTVWNEEAGVWDRTYDCEATWDFRITLSGPDHVIRLEPGLPVNTLDVEATITQVEVSPLGVYVYIEGNALQGHHGWVPKNAPDGWYGCIEYQEITLYTKDGAAIPATEGIAGSGCSGGSDPTEPGYLHLARRFDTLVDLDSLDRIEICGVSIPLHE